MINKLLYGLGYIVITLISHTWRYRIAGKRPNAPGIVAFWHGYMLPGWRLFRKMNAAAVVSPSKDGELLAGLLRRWGFSLVRGSSDKKGKETLENIIAKSKESLLVMTPDGPRGPIYEFKAGAVVGAKKAGVALTLCKIKVYSGKALTKSWDKFMIPYPFARIDVEFSEPILIPEGLDFDQTNEIIINCGKFLNNEMNSYE